jgi:hypothetical protein
MKVLSLLTVVDFLYSDNKTIRRPFHIYSSSNFGLEIREYGHRDVTLTTWHPISAEVRAKFADKRRSLGRYSSLAD